MFLCKGRCVSLGSFVVRRNDGLFCGMLFGSCTDTGRTPYCCASQVFYKTRTAEEGLQRPPSGKHKRTDSLLCWGLAFFSSGSFHVLVGCPWSGHKLCHCARNIVLSFMLLLLLLNYNMWLLFYDYFSFECFKKKSFKSVDLLMYSAFAAMDQNQKNRVDKLYCIRRKSISY